MHVRSESMKCSNPACSYCGTPPRRRLSALDVAGLVAVVGTGLLLLVMLVLAAVFPR